LKKNIFHEILQNQKPGKQITYHFGSFEAIYRAKIRDGHAYPQNLYKVITKKADVAKK
jgi:hypothetical protein